MFWYNDNNWGGKSMARRKKDAIGGMRLAALCVCLTAIGILSLGAWLAVVGIP